MGIFVLSEPIVAAIVAALSVAGAVQERSVDLTDLSLEDLMRMDVTVASRRSQPLQDVPAAAYVITEEDISRSSATSIPELLRGVPGLHVGQIDQSKWMVSARGFNGRFANKLLVLIDGRSVYSPLFSGVWWSMVDLPLEEIERIEIVRGPGGSLWGTNAVNGTINIITKHAATTLGTTFRLGTGTKELQNGYVGFGDTVGDGGFWRIFASGRQTLQTTTVFGADAGDGWDDFRFGGRLDYNLSESESGTLDFLATGMHQGMTMEMPSFTGNLSTLRIVQHSAHTFSTRASWRRDLGSAGSDAAQFYLDLSNITNLGVHQHRTTMSAEFVSTRTVGKGQDLSFGAGYKTSSDLTDKSAFLSLNPSRATLQFWNGFVSDRFALSPKLSAELMLKFEASTLEGLHTLPTGRLSYKQDPKTTYWLSSSRAMGTPSRFDLGVDVDIKHETGPGLPIAVHIIGANKMKPAMVESLEAGVRFQPNDDLSIDVAAFYNRYYDLRTFELGAMTIVNDPVPHIRQEYVLGNKLNAETAGLEVSADWRLKGKARITASYSLFSERFRKDPDSTDPFPTTAVARSGVTPNHQLTLRASIPAGRSSSFELDMYSVGALELGGLPDYFRLDVQYKTKLSSGLQLSAGVRNLFADGHVEGAKSLYEVPSRIPTQAFLNLSWRF